MNETIENLHGEVWVPIYREYEISNMGRVKSNKGKTPRILKPYTDKNGYKGVIFKFDGMRIGKKIHRLVGLVFVNNLNPLRITVNHEKEKWDNRAESLSWMTYMENSRHGVANGLLKRGSKHHNSKLDETQVKTIRSLYDEFSLTDMAKYFNVSISTIYMVCRHKRWGHL